MTAWRISGEVFNDEFFIQFGFRFAPVAADHADPSFDHPDQLSTRPDQLSAEFVAEQFEFVGKQSLGVDHQLPFFGEFFANEFRRHVAG